MISERTMRSLKGCQETATQINEALSTVLANIKHFTMILQIKNNNLNQSKTEKASICKISKYLQSDVYDAMMKKAHTVKEASQKLHNMQDDTQTDVTADLKDYLSCANELVAEFGFIKKQLNNVSINLRLHDASIKWQMSECVEKFDAIITGTDSIITMLLTQIGTIEDVLDGVKTN